MQPKLLNSWKSKTRKNRIHLAVLYVSILLFSACNTNKVSKISVKGKDFITENGDVIRLKGVSFSDPDKLENDAQWNFRYFQEAKNWGCNLVRFPVHPPRLNDRGWDAYFALLDKGVAWAEQLGMYVIIDWNIIGNLHEEKWFLPIYNTTYEETVKFWKKTAQHYKGNPTVAVY